MPSGPVPVIIITTTSTRSITTSIRAPAVAKRPGQRVQAPRDERLCAAPSLNAGLASSRRQAFCKLKQCPIGILHFGLKKPSQSGTEKAQITAARAGAFLSGPTALRDAIGWSAAKGTPKGALQTGRRRLTLLLMLFSFVSVGKGQEAIRMSLA